MRTIARAGLPKRPALNVFTTSSSPVCPSLSGTASEGSNECLPCLHDAQCPLKRCEKLIRLLARQAIARRRVVVDKHDERLTPGLGRSLFWIVLYAKASHSQGFLVFPGFRPSFSAIASTTKCMSAMPCVTQCSLR